MTRRQPRDAAFNKVILEETKLTVVHERVIFIDTENQIREAIYPSEFQSGRLQETRERLESDGVLKAVVHVAADRLGAPKARGPFVTVVEYLPEQRYYTALSTPAQYEWDEPDPEAIKTTQQLFGNGEEGEPSGEA